MQQYLDLVSDVFENGDWDESNRTGVPCLSVDGAVMRFDMQHGFPAVTTKKLAFKAVVAELCAFLRAYRSAADFRALGCKVWDQNANENKEWLANPNRLGEDDLGMIYGQIWRGWPAYKLIDASQTDRIQYAQQRGFRVVSVLKDMGVDKVLLYKAIDQIRECLDTIMTDPGSRRILFHAWNCAELDNMALNPCHTLYQLFPKPATREINLTMYVRSNDLGLGTPFNVSQGAVLLHIIGRLTGYKPRKITYMIGSAHIYQNHVSMLEEQMTRDPYPLPQLKISDRVPDYAVTGVYDPSWLEKIVPEDFTLVGYRHHPHLSAPMAV